jgi:hypothetical protein
MGTLSELDWLVTKDTEPLNNLEELKQAYCQYLAEIEVEQLIEEGPEYLTRYISRLVESSANEIYLTLKVDKINLEQFRDIMRNNVLFPEDNIDFFYNVMDEKIKSFQEGKSVDLSKHPLGLEIYIDNNIDRYMGYKCPACDKLYLGNPNFEQKILGRSSDHGLRRFEIKGSCPQGHLLYKKEINPEKKDLFYLFV